MKTPAKVYRVAIHNQIMATTYYLIRAYVPGQRGGWTPGGYADGPRPGKSGYGRALGYSKGQAEALAADRNRALGWSKGQRVQTSKGSEAFTLHA